ncbi:MAG: PilZ domain-containing protein [Gemmataceae bacterium]|nr:PilZ domain-containing protein [Gemmataceae bacterium]
MADDEPISSEQPSVSLDRDRRAYLRIPSNLAATCHDAPRTREPAWSGRVHNISQGGIGLILQHRFGPGTTLLVDLRETTGAVLRTVRARVVHATAILDGGSPCWLLGCVFDQPLDETEFSSLR